MIWLRVQAPAAGTEHAVAELTVNGAEAWLAPEVATIGSLPTASPVPVPETAVIVMDPVRLPLASAVAVAVSGPLHVAQAVVNVTLTGPGGQL
jgi:hypothetical protein